MPVPPKLVLGAKALEQLIQLTQNSAAQAVLTSARVILETVDAGKKEDPDRQRLAESVLDIALAYGDGLRKLELADIEETEIAEVTSNLLRTLQTISNALQSKPKSNFLTRAVLRSSTKKTLKGYEADLSHSASILDIQIKLRSLKLLQAAEVESNRKEMERVMEERFSQAHQEEIAMIKSQVIKQNQKKLQISSFGHLPPSPPQIFFGRSDSADILVESLVNVPSYHAILGPGGIGKTSLALNVINHPLVVSVYGQYRFFLACETTTDANGIIAGISDILNLDEKSFVKSLKRVCGIIDSEILFLLDNFETPWENPENRQKVEELLIQLCDIPNLSLLITLRGAERPAGVPWSRPFLPVLGPLDFISARQTFVTIADVREDDPNMIKLLEEVEGVPLAITLLANQAQYLGCESLLKRWDSVKTSTISSGWDSRLSSLDVSISLSLASSRFTSNPEAMSFLQILSLLPDGATVDELESMASPGFNVHKSVATVCQVALAYAGAHKRIRALAPIREYMQSKHPISHALLQPVLSYHSALATYASDSEWTAETTKMVEKLNICIGNIHHVIRVGSSVDTMSEQAIRAAIDIASFHRNSYSGSISVLLEYSMNLARLSQNFSQQAECMVHLALDIMTRSSDYKAAEGYFREAANIFRLLPGATDHLVFTLTNLSRLMYLEERDSEALQLSQEAVILLSESTPPVICSLARIQLAPCLNAKGDFMQASKSLELAASHFASSDYSRLARRYSETSVQIYTERDLYRKAVKAADMGLSTDTFSQRDWRDGALLTRRGLAYMCLGEYQTARDDFKEGIQLLASAGKDWLMASSLKWLGMTYLACSDFDAASTNFRLGCHLDSSVVFFGLNEALATLYLHQNYFDEALYYCEKSAEDVHDMPTVSYAKQTTTQRLAQIQIRRGDAAEAISASVLAAIIAHRTLDRGSTAMAILCLGDAYYFIENDITAAKCCYQAGLDLLRYTGARRWISNALMRIGVMDHFEGDSRLAARRLNQAARFYRETEGDAWAEFCMDRLKAIESGTIEENMPYFPPIFFQGF